MIAKREGIEIPQTIDEYTKRFDKKLPGISNDNMQDYIIDEDGDDDDDDDDEQSENRSQSSRIKLHTNSEIKIAIKSTTQEYSTTNNSCRDSVK